MEEQAVPAELLQALHDDDKARTFFENLAAGYRRRYCEWVGRPKRAATREARAQWALHLLGNEQKILKVDSFMGDVGIVKKIDDISELRDVLMKECAGKSHKDISRYSLLLAEHILSLTGTAHDQVIDECFDINKRWQAGTASFQEARDVAGHMNSRAREEKDPVKAKVFRILGQVAATPHVIRHALIASDYAVTLINLLYPGDFAEVRKERTTQIEMMKSV